MVKRTTIFTLSFGTIGKKGAALFTNLSVAKTSSIGVHINLFTSDLKLRVKQSYLTNQSVV